ncbi:MAG TPA: DUF4252 domain-containing protein [Puia sp.]|nr:DUF4252 domain-containing protein [Puia sp.]
MKKLLTPLLVLVTAASCHAQDSHLDQFYRKFDGHGAETTQGTINLALLLNFSSSDTSNRWFRKVTLCRFMAIQPEKSPAAGEEWDELQQSLKEDHFEEWMSVRHGKDNFRMLSRVRSDGQQDIVCLAASPHGGGVFFHVRGRFSAADLEKIESSLENSDKSDGSASQTVSGVHIVRDAR